MKRKAGLLLGNKRAQAHLPLHKRGGQATLELALSFIILTLFLLGTVKIMLWFGNNLSGRAQSYRATRTKVITKPSGEHAIGYRQSRLSLFND